MDLVKHDFLKKNNRRDRKDENEKLKNLGI